MYSGTKGNVRRLSPRGDDLLSANDCHYWSLCYQVLKKFGVPVIFKYERGSVPHRIDGGISWFIPQERFEEIKQYLYYELRRDIRAGQDIECSDGRKEWFPGFRVEFYPFSGLSSYLERDDSERMTRNLIRTWRNKNLRDFINYEFEKKHFRLGMVLGTVATAVAVGLIFLVH